jgi:short-subunit dehydrogenase
MKIAGRLVLVTGASSGIGAATAKAMARRGGRLLLMARTRPALEQVAAEIRNFGRQRLDLSDGPVGRTDGLGNRANYAAGGGRSRHPH